MTRALRLVSALVVGLGLLTWVGSRVVQHTARSWFEADLAQRARLAVTGAARPALVASFGHERRAELGRLLAEMATDRIVLAAAACGADLTTLAETPGFPAELTCARTGLLVRPADGGRAWTPWSGVRSLAEGEVHVSAVPVADRERTLGFVVVVHDLSTIESRVAQTRLFLLLGLGFLALAACAVTVVVRRLSWRGFLRELRAALRGDAARREFQPILGDVRELVERFVADQEGGAWTPERLRSTLSRYFHGERIVIIANREPYHHERAADGAGIDVRHPASGLVTALEPVMRACSGTWIAHGSGSADRETADWRGRVRVPPGEESYVLRRVWLSAEEEQGYYYGFANEGLWPLCHIAHTRPLFRSEDWTQYQAVNRKFADALVEEVDAEDPVVLVHDYHFAPLPRLIRERLPRATVIMFWHIPWPNSQSFGICPWREELLDGMLGASILGFHTQFDCNNFVGAVDRFLEARIDREQGAIVQRGRHTLVHPYPISLDWPNRWAKETPPVEVCRASVFAELGLPPDARLGLGVDRLDYTKGIEERLLAVERLLERHPALRGRFTFVQLAAPSRTAIERYRELERSVRELVARVNLRFGREGYRPVVLLCAHHEPPTVFRFYRAADLCYVSSLHDGMNLVAKEFVAARQDEAGVLVLSQFTGAARELTEALIVNPYDLDQASAALAAALAMSRGEQTARMRSMRALVSEFNVYRWAGRMLVDAARLRHRDRLTDRLGDPLSVPAGAGR